MTITTAALFVFYELFFAFLTYWYSSAMRANPEDLAEIEAKLWREDTALASGATMLLLAFRVNGVAFLVYLGFQTTWYIPIVLWLATFVVNASINALLRVKLGRAELALPGFVVLPIVGVLMWFTV
jgi:hypothetical protein